MADDPTSARRDRAVDSGSAPDLKTPNPIPVAQLQDRDAEPYHTHTHRTAHTDACLELTGLGQVVPTPFRRHSLPRPTRSSVDGYSPTIKSPLGSARRSVLLSSHALSRPNKEHVLASWGERGVHLAKPMEKNQEAIERQPRGPDDLCGEGDEENGSSESQEAFGRHLKEPDDLCGEEDEENGRSESQEALERHLMEPDDLCGQGNEENVRSESQETTKIAAEGPVIQAETKHSNAKHIDHGDAKHCDEGVSAIPPSRDSALLRSLYPTIGTHMFMYLRSAISWTPWLFLSLTCLVTLDHIRTCCHHSPPSTGPIPNDMVTNSLLLNTSLSARPTTALVAAAAALVSYRYRLMMPQCIDMSGDVKSSLMHVVETLEVDLRDLSEWDGSTTTLLLAEDHPTQELRQLESRLDDWKARGRLRRSLRIKLADLVVLETESEQSDGSSTRMCQRALNGFARAAERGIMLASHHD